MLTRQSVYELLIENLCNLVPLKLRFEFGPSKKTIGNKILEDTAGQAKSLEKY